MQASAERWGTDELDMHCHPAVNTENLACDIGRFG